MKNKSLFIFRTLVLLLILFCLVFPSLSAEAALKGMKLCFNSVLPALFPFFVLCALFFELGLYRGIERVMSPVFSFAYRLPGICACALLFGLISGYPLGAKTAADLYSKNMCSKNDAERLLFFCNTSGPGFIIGAVGGGLFKSSKIGWLLYLSHLAAAILCGFFSRFLSSRNTYYVKTAKPPKAEKYINLPLLFVKTVKDAFFSLLGVCAFVIFFSVVIDALYYTGIFALIASGISKIFPFIPSKATEGVLSGIVEMTTGTKLLCSGIPLSIAFVATAFVLGFGGFSVHCQALSFLLPSGLSPVPYICGKGLHAVLSAVIAYLLLPFVSVSTPAFAFVNTPVQSCSFTLWLYIILFGFSALCTVLPSLRPKNKG